MPRSLEERSPPAPDAGTGGAPLALGLHGPALCKEGRHQGVRHENPVESLTPKGGFPEVPVSFLTLPASVCDSGRTDHPSVLRSRAWPGATIHNIK